MTVYFWGSSNAAGNLLEPLFRCDLGAAATRITLNVLWKGINVGNTVLGADDILLTHGITCDLHLFPPSRRGHRAEI